jgi:hypothetical protein
MIAILKREYREGDGYIHSSGHNVQGDRMQAVHGIQCYD